MMIRRALSSATTVLPSAMHAIHAIQWVSGGRPHVLRLRQGEEPTGPTFKLSAQRDGEKSWFSIGEGSGDELHRNVTYVRASTDKRFAIKVCAFRAALTATALTRRPLCRWTGTPRR